MIDILGMALDEAKHAGWTAASARLSMSESDRGTIYLKIDGYRHSNAEYVRLGIDAMAWRYAVDQAEMVAAKIREAVSR